MKLGNFWIVFSILGIIAIIIPAATMGTNIFFDLNLFLFVVGIATLYAFGSGGSKLLWGNTGETFYKYLAHTSST